MNLCQNKITLFTLSNGKKIITLPNQPRTRIFKLPHIACDIIETISRIFMVIGQW